MSPSVLSHHLSFWQSWSKCTFANIWCFCPPPLPTPTQCWWWFVQRGPSTLQRCFGGKGAWKIESWLPTLKMCITSWQLVRCPKGFLQGLEVLLDNFRSYQLVMDLTFMSHKQLKVPMKWKIICAYLKGLSKYRRMAFFVLKYLFSF